MGGSGIDVVLRVSELAFEVVLPGAMRHCRPDSFGMAFGDLCLLRIGGTGFGEVLAKEMGTGMDVKESRDDLEVCGSYEKPCGGQQTVK